MDDVLGSLCSTCHAGPPKYKCPKCSSRNCSLPCYKRHQILASCSGIRDPTAYVKKAALFTPSGVDHDFNFLSSVISKVSQNEQDTIVWRARTITSQWRRKRADEFWQRVKDMGLTVHCAPIGLSREKKNRTQYIRKLDDILWTVEWLFEDGSSALSQTLNSTKVSSAYASHINRKPRRVKRKAGALGEPTPEIPQPVLEGEPTDCEPAERSPEEESTERSDDAKIAEDEGHNDAEFPPPSSASGPDVNGAPTVIQPSNVDASTEDPPQDGVDDIPSPQPPDETHAGICMPFIYLVKPRTTGSRRVLIPVDVSQTVRDALINNEVDEFPTFQTLSSPSTNLPGGYILLEDYLKAFQTNHDRMTDLVSDVGMTTSHESRPVPSSNDIMATLQRDTAEQVS